MPSLRSFLFVGLGPLSLGGGWVWRAATSGPDSLKYDGIEVQANRDSLDSGVLKRSGIIGTIMDALGISAEENTIFLGEFGSEIEHELSFYSTPKVWVPGVLLPVIRGRETA
ncbi:unnamed protein product, partial [Discosporangium mesarthrocarpum]